MYGYCHTYLKIWMEKSDLNWMFRIIIWPLLTKTQHVYKTLFSSLPLIKKKGLIPMIKMHQKVHFLISWFQKVGNLTLKRVVSENDYKWNRVNFNLSFSYPKIWQWFYSPLYLGAKYLKDIHLLLQGVLKVFYRFLWNLNHLKIWKNCILFKTICKEQHILSNNIWNVGTFTSIY